MFSWFDSVTTVLDMEQYGHKPFQEELLSIYYQYAHITLESSFMRIYYDLLDTGVLTDSQMEHCGQDSSLKFFKTETGTTANVTLKISKSPSETVTTPPAWPVQRNELAGLMRKIPTSFFAKVSDTHILCNFQTEESTEDKCDSYVVSIQKLKEYCTVVALCTCFEIEEYESARKFLPNEEFNYKLSNEAYGQLLVHLVYYNNINAIVFLCENYSTFFEDVFNRTLVKKIFDLVILHDMVEMFDVMCQMITSKWSHEAKMEYFFKVAIKFNSVRITEFILTGNEFYRERKLRDKDIKHSERFTNPKVLSQLRSFNINESIIMDALKYAVNKKHNCIAQMITKKIKDCPESFKRLDTDTDKLAMYFLENGYNEYFMIFVSYIRNSFVIQELLRKAIEIGNIWSFRYMVYNCEVNMLTRLNVFETALCLKKFTEAKLIFHPNLETDSRLESVIVKSLNGNSYEIVSFLVKECGVEFDNARAYLITKIIENGCIETIKFLTEHGVKFLPLRSDNEPYIYICSVCQMGLGCNCQSTNSALRVCCNKGDLQCIDFFYYRYSANRSETALKISLLSKNMEVLERMLTNVKKIVYRTQAGMNDSLTNICTDALLLCRKELQYDELPIEMVQLLVTEGKITSNKIGTLLIETCNTEVFKTFHNFKIIELDSKKRHGSWWSLGIKSYIQEIFFDYFGTAINHNATDIVRYLMTTSVINSSEHKKRILGNKKYHQKLVSGMVLATAMGLHVIKESLETYGISLDEITPNEMTKITKKLFKNVKIQQKACYDPCVLRLDTPKKGEIYIEHGGGNEKHIITYEYYQQLNNKKTCPYCTTSMDKLNTMYIQVIDPPKEDLSRGSVNYN